ncbi:MAG: hypothetical protein ACP5N9_03615 [Candidatus Bilamarchaeum sp.]|jgi:hypothetical protein
MVYFIPNKGIMAIDALVSFIPIVLMLSFTLNLVYSFSAINSENFHNQQVFDKLVSISDYSMKVGLVEGNTHNLLDLSKATSEYILDLEKRASLSRLSISTEEKEGYLFCISRLGVRGPSKDVVRIYFCGD